ncbi:uncharacterized protein BKCO1_680008 [Diplodia corticola]|uniref:Uncharacterized protein n=1 Tax=Diplodia corticola TaxID=236234 RepID=A0A1J9QM52_9PEZI|nr:uncharacterized protein BKCO1_680008 [Diplodia corticola]OJD29990.1 hypothetical protein BKCO1_680008 [Diplodia corticola]
MATLDEVLHACVDQPLDTVLSLASTCSHERCEIEMARAAATDGRADLLDYLVHNATTSLEPCGMLLLTSAGAHSKACVQVMLDQGLDINRYDDRIGGVLHWALGGGGCPEDFITWLLERGALVNHPEDSWCDIHCLLPAVSHGTVPIMKILVAAGANVGSSAALHYAVRCGYLDKVKYLVEEAGVAVDTPAGVDTNSFSPFYWCGDAGSTPLHVAAAHNQVAAAEYLLEMGADMAAKNAGGRTPLQEAEYLSEVAATEPKSDRRTLQRNQRFLFSGYFEGHREILAFLRQQGTGRA